MEKMLAIVFKDEKTAYEGARALSDLAAEGSISVYGAAVIQKNKDGMVATKRVEEEFPIRTFAGTAIGSVIGILGGPVGVAIGAATGAVGGLVADVYTSGLDSDFLSEVSTALIPGKWAVVADVGEDWVTPLDTRMEALGGVVYRTVKTAFEDEQWAREAAAARAELEQLKIEHAQARADRKAKLQAQIERLGKRVEAKLAQAKSRSKQVAQEFQAKVQALQKKADKEKGDSRAAYDAQIARLRTDYESRPHA